MKRNTTISFIYIWALTAALAALPHAAICSPQTNAQNSSPTADQLKFYNDQVKPILKTACLSCHGVGTNVSGGLSLNSHESILKGGSSGSAIDTQKADQSLIVRAINYDGRQMPPTGKLPKQQIDILT